MERLLVKTTVVGIVGDPSGELAVPGQPVVAELPALLLVLHPLLDKPVLVHLALRAGDLHQTIAKLN